MLALLPSNRLVGDQAAWGLDQTPFAIARLRLAQGGGPDPPWDTPALSQRPLPARAMTRVLGSIYGVVCVRLGNGKGVLYHPCRHKPLMLTTLTRVLPVALTVYVALQPPV